MGESGCKVGVGGGRSLTEALQRSAGSKGYAQHGMEQSYRLHMYFSQN
jgi:N-acetylneuraminic acid mutarotase